MYFGSNTVSIAFESNRRFLKKKSTVEDLGGEKVRCAVNAKHVALRRVSLQTFQTSPQAAVSQILVFESYYVVHFYSSYSIHSATFSGDLDRSRLMLGCDFCVGGEAGLDGGDPGTSFSRAASALQRGQSGQRRGYESDSPKGIRARLVFLLLFLPGGRRASSTAGIAVIASVQ